MISFILILFLLTWTLFISTGLAPVCLRLRRQFDHPQYNPQKSPSLFPTWTLNIEYWILNIESSLLPSPSSFSPSPSAPLFPPGLQP